MQGEVDAQETLRPIRILGINDAGAESGNDGMTTDRVLPWLQPAAGEDLGELWQIEYRDVVILGAANQHIGTFNLTQNDLSDPLNYAALKDQLLEAANE